MKEFPRSLAEFEAQFDTEQAYRSYLFRLRWPGGFRCPRCGGAPFWLVSYNDGLDLAAQVPASDGAAGP